MAEIDTYLNTIANSTDGEKVRDAIINCMNEINKDTKFKVLSKVITHHVGTDNTHYYAGSGKVWKDVTLDIVLPDGSSEEQTGTSTVDFTVNNSTENGDYPPESGTKWGTIHVDIDWSQYANEDIGEIAEITTDELDANSTFHAETYGFSAIRAVKFSNVRSTGNAIIGPGNQPSYNIQYKNEAGALMDEQLVPAGENAGDYYKGTVPPDTGRSGILYWSPDSSKRVYKHYTGANALVAHYSYSAGGGDTVTDSWEQIVSNGGKNVKIGDHKVLVLAEDRTVSIPEKTFELMSFYINPETHESTDQKWRVKAEAKQYSGIAIDMVCVGKGEPGSSTSWVSAGTINLPHAQLMKPDGELQGGYVWGLDFSSQNDSNFILTTDWEDSAIRQYMNTNEFLDLFPAEVKSAIKMITKAFYGISSHTAPNRLQDITIMRKTKASRIWIPSCSEFRSIFNGTFNEDHCGARYPMTYYTLDTTQANYTDYYTLNTSDREILTRDFRRIGWYGGHSAVLQMSSNPTADGKYKIDTTQQYIGGAGPTGEYIPIGFCL